ncbi:glutamic acid-rich protein-like [Pistacia vera]|uniref:glutamic acid-rich protein-like n=1 Tax=Pistacia vera TaxID=55513 RepID=UPI001263DC7D|nr:glutamic acid-rich protein-like [Pistacia vera]XP_031285540.1 glutamic acid-rich protein-like [Pistacia vera]XP_031285541.1 glutamic acid-rich protein-like [Pistacia vera]
MSRCFPFPPPGYEKSARVEDTDLLAKEKHQEKKHKKDKKDKEKQGGKEKKNKDKERSKEKHSDKKDRKEKHKDKKDRDKDKDKNRISDAKRIEGQPECYNGGKIGPNSLQNNGIKDTKYVQDLAKRIRNEDKATGSQIVQKITVTDQRRAELPRRILECSTDILEEKEKAKDKKEVDKKINGQKNHVEARGFGNSIAQGFSGTDQKRFQGITKPVEKNDIEKQLEEREKNMRKESDSKGDKQKDRDRKKKSRSKDKSRDKEKKKEEKAKEIVEPSKDRLKLKDSPKLKDNGKGLPSSCNIRPPDVSKTSNNNPPGEGSLGKRKELEINGISHDNGIRPNKLPRPVSSSHLVTENGRKMEPCQTAIHFASEFQGAVGNHKVNAKEHKINGLRNVSQPIVCSTKPLSTIDQGSEHCEASAKPPHPDSKYLNQILSSVAKGVPKLEDWPDFDDDEWLFCSDSVQSKQAKVASPRGDGTQQVWAEVLPIESAGVTALPYVVPF